MSLPASSEPKNFAVIVMLVTDTGDKVVYHLGRARGVRGLRPHAEGPYVADAMIDAFKSLTGNIDTTTSGGKLIFHIFGALAEFERDLIRERTNAGSQLPDREGRRATKVTSQRGEETAAG